MDDTICPAQLQMSPASAADSMIDFSLGADIWTAIFDSLSLSASDAVEMEFPSLVEDGNFTIPSHAPETFDHEALAIVPCDTRFDGPELTTSLTSSALVPVDKSPTPRASMTYLEPSASQLDQRLPLSDVPKGFCHPTTSDWDSKRATIQHFYIDQNLNLQDVMEIMKQRYNFHATVKMYKSRFTKWGTGKYNKRRKQPDEPKMTRNDGVRSCLRRNDLRTRALLHESTTTRLKQEALMTLRDFCGAFIDLDDWQCQFAAHDVADLVSFALRNISDNDNVNGFAYLRRAFLQMEIALHSPNSGDAFELVTQVVEKCLEYGREEIISIYLRHMMELCLPMQIRHPLGRVASALLKLLGAGSNHLTHFVCSTYDMFDNSLSQSVATSDVYSHTLQLEYRVMSTIFKIEMRICNEDLLRRTVQQAAAQFDQFIWNRSGQDDAFKNVRHLEYRRLYIQHFSDIYLDDFASRCQRLKESVLTAVVNVSPATSGWNVEEEAIQCFSCQRFLAIFWFEGGNTDLALSQLNEMYACLKAGVFGESTVLFKLVTNVERDLLYLGLNDAAEKVMQAWNAGVESGRRYISLCETVKELDNLQHETSNVAGLP